MSILALFGAAFASPISVDDLRIQDDNGDYLLLVTLSNANTSTGLFDEVKVTIEELGTTKVVDTVKIDTTDSVVEVYNLRDSTDSFNLLKRGETYRVTVSTSENSKSGTILFGSEDDAGDDGLGVILEEVEIDGVEVKDVDSLQVMNGETLDVDLRLFSNYGVEDARIMVFVEGYEHSPLVSSTSIFNLVGGKTYVKSLSVTLPDDMDSQKDYKLRIVGANDLSGITYKEYTLFVDTDRHRVDILDLVMTPSSGVEPGQNIIANVRMKNRGQMSQDSVKVTVAIPELGVSESSYISNLNADEVATSDDMLLFVPSEATAGNYNVKVTLSYDDGYTASTETFSLNILSPEVAAEENLLVSFRNNVDLAAGETNSFEVVIANPNSDSKPISIVPVENAWADVEVSPTLSMINGGSSATFTISVTPKSAASGEKQLSLVVKEGANTVNEFSVATFVDEGETINWLNVILVVLLILAIIVLLALVISIAKRKNDRDDDEEISSSEEYY